MEARIEGNRHYPALDGLRACAVLMVFFQHYLLAYIPNLWQWGWAGVDFFFVLSGFLITGILYDTRESQHHFKNFYIRRTLRIFPLYYGVLLVILLLSPVMHWEWSFKWLCWPLYVSNYVRFAFMGEFLLSHRTLESLFSTKTIVHIPVRLFLGHFWSLAVEEQFYLLWPLVVFTIKERVKLRNVCACVVVLMPFIRLVSGFLLPHSWIQEGCLERMTPFRADALLLGGMLALMIRGREGDTLKRIAPKVGGICLLILFLVPAIAPVVSARVDVGSSSLWMGSFGLSLIELFGGSVILMLLNDGSQLSRLLSFAPIRRLGEISYGFYVFHDIPHLFYIAIAMSILGKYSSGAMFLTIPIAFVFTLFLSLVSYRFFEMPFLRLKDRLAPAPR